MTLIWTIVPGQQGATGSNTITPGTAKFYKLNDSTVSGVATEDMTVDITVYVPTVITQLFGRVDTAPTTGKSVVVTLFVNGVATNLTFTIGATGTAGSDITHVVNLVPGDYYSLKIDPTTGAASTKFQGGALVSV